MIILLPHQLNSLVRKLEQETYTIIYFLRPFISCARDDDDKTYIQSNTLDWWNSLPPTLLSSLFFCSNTCLETSPFSSTHLIIFLFFFVLLVVVLVNDLADCSSLHDSLLVIPCYVNEGRVLDRTIFRSLFCLHFSLPANLETSKQSNLLPGNSRCLWDEEEKHQLRHHHHRCRHHLKSLVEAKLSWCIFDNNNTDWYDSRVVLSVSWSLFVTQEEKQELPTPLCMTDRNLNCYERENEEH